MNAIELAEKLDQRAKANFEANKRFGRTGPEWAIERELDYRAARLLREMHEALRPFVSLAAEVDYLRHEDGSTSLHRLYARDLRRARKAYEAKP